MNWQVLWGEEAGRAFLRAMRGSRLGRVIEADVLGFNALMRANLDVVGESRASGERVLLAPPYVLKFQVFNDEQRVVVTYFRYFGDD